MQALQIDRLISSVCLFIWELRGKIQITGKYQSLTAGYILNYMAQSFRGQNYAFLG